MARPSVARFEPSTTTWCGITLDSQPVQLAMLDRDGCDERHGRLRCRRRMIEAVLWDFGGVILSSPFEAFNHYEAAHGLPARLHPHRSTPPTRTPTPGPGSSAARSRRPSSTTAFADESEALGHGVPRRRRARAARRRGAAGDGRSARRASRRPGYKIACLTNNVVGGDGERRRASPSAGGASDRRDHGPLRRRSSSSSKVGVRKPEPRFYEIACELLGVEPTECVFLDDLGINLKPAAAMGMTTIKVLTAEQAIADLEAIARHPAALTRVSSPTARTSADPARVGRATRTRAAPDPTRQTGREKVSVHEVGELLVVDRLASRWPGCRSRRGRRGAGRSRAP